MLARQWRPPAQRTLLLLLAIGIGLALRVAWLREVPLGYNQDEAVSAYDAYSIALTGRDHHGHPFPVTALESFGDWVSPLLTLLSVPAAGLVGPRVEAVRSVSVLVGTLAVPLVYALAAQLWDRPGIGLVAAWLIALSPWHVALSRFAIPPATVATMLALTLALLLSAVRRQSSRGIVFAAIAAGLTIACYPTMKLYVPLLGAVVVLLYWREIRAINREALLYAVLVFALIAGPILYLSTADPGGRARITQVSAFQGEHVSALTLVRQYLAYLAPSFFLSAGDRYANTLPPGAGVELRVVAPFFLAGVIWLGAQLFWPSGPHGRRSAAVVLAALLLYPVPGALTLPNPYALRAVHLIPLAAIIGAAGMTIAADLAVRGVHAVWPGAAPNRVTLALGLALALLAGSELTGRYRDYFTAYPVRTALDFHFGVEEALAYARTHEQEYDEIWVVNVNQPYIFVLAYGQWPPSEAHAKLVVRRNPPDFNQVDQLGKYRFPELWGKPPPDIRPDALAIVYTVYTPDRRIAYQLRSGYVQKRGRVLLMFRP